LVPAPHLSEQTIHAAQTVWDYMLLRQPLQKCDVAIAMGSHDLRTADYAARLVLDGWAPLLVCSGASGRLTRGAWQQTEARAFADQALQAGLGQDHLLLEEHSTNTSENLQFSAHTLAHAGISFNSALLIHKPYMERRVWATAAKVWPRTQVVVSSPPIPMRAYATASIPLEEVIAIMAGDLQRVIEYPRRGFAIQQEIPNQVLAAFDLLTRNGFVSHLLSPQS
jgi:uncharacterized SAM-binding protein YcdF (DUF218 family)